jgi:hypothetical protein
VQNNKLTPGNIVILVAGIVMLIASFLDFYEFGPVSASSWDRDTFLFGIATLPVLFGLIMAAHVALTAFASVNLPDRPLTFTWDQVHIALGFQSTIMMIAFLLRDKGFLDFGIGFWLMLLSAIALLVGAIMRQRETAPHF